MSLLALVTVIALGLSAGAMLTEAALIVGIWRAMPADAFLQWFAANEPRLVSFYGALEVLTTVLVLVTAGVAIFGKHASGPMWGAAAGLSIAVLVLFFVYFQAVNSSFVAGTIALDAVPAELSRWGTWQWVRTACGTGAFVAGALALRQ